jgi:hypothetical protein
MAVLFVVQKGWGRLVLFPIANANETVGYAEHVLGEAIGWI